MPAYPALAPFIEALNADPCDWQRVGVLGDFLQEDHDPGIVPPSWKVYGPGMVALAHLRRQPHFFTEDMCWGWLRCPYPDRHHESCKLPSFWWDYIEASRHIIETHIWKHTLPKQHKTRGGVTILKAAARAFTKMPAEWQARVMSQPAGELEGAMKEVQVDSAARLVPRPDGLASSGGDAWTGSRRL